MMKTLTINDQTKLRFYILNRDLLVQEETFEVKQLKKSYQKLWLISQGDYQRFVCDCLDIWCKNFNGTWNVATFDIV